MLLEICFVILLSFGNLACWVPMIISLLLRKIQAFHRRVTSDIPGASLSVFAFLSDSR
jgi:hypothetical protein